MKTILIIAALLGATSIMLGAFGAHSLKTILNATELQSFETGVRYQMYHVLVIFLIAFLPQIAESSKKIVAYLFLVGILFFSGSIYAITFGVNPALIWFVTPIGGLLFIIRWVSIAYFLLKLKN